MTRATLYLGDCRLILEQLAPNSVDAVVCDPPYELGFMGKAWDSTGIAFQPSTWAAVLRVLKPGGHLLAFGGSRTYHRMACAIEDAGFEIRDQIMWVFSSGFPKSLDVAKAIDKAAGAQPREVGRKSVGNGNRKGAGFNHGGDAEGLPVTEPVTAAAQQWAGWGTALKPAHEPLVLARKPFRGTVAANVQAHGTGALNIAGARIAPTGEHAPRDGEASAERRYAERGATDLAATPGPRGGDPLGRWPANLIHDGSEEVVAAFPDAPGQQRQVTGNEPTANGFSGPVKFSGRRGRQASAPPRLDSGSAARFYYVPKTSASDRNDGLSGHRRREVKLHAQALTNGSGGLRNGDGSIKPRENHHPTVKPTELMRYLCRLVTPPGGVVLDPFMGSGSTGRGAALESFDFVGVERETEYFDIAAARIKAAGGMLVEIFEVRPADLSAQLEDARAELEEANEGGDLEDRMAAAQRVADLEARLAKRARAA